MPPPALRRPSPRRIFAPTPSGNGAASERGEDAAVHRCPNCGHTCDCDGDRTHWYMDGAESEACLHCIEGERAHPRPTRGSMLMRLARVLRPGRRAAT